MLTLKKISVTFTLIIHLPQDALKPEHTALATQVETFDRWNSYRTINQRIKTS